MVAVSSARLLNNVDPVNSQELVKWVYAVGLSDTTGPFMVQLLNRRLLPRLKPYDVVLVSACWH